MANDDVQTNGSEPGGVRGALAYWGPPVAIGLVVGLALAWLWRVGGIGDSDVDQIVRRWQWGEHEANAALAEEISALGASARADVVAAFHDVSDDHPDLKVWVAERLTEAPFYDNKTLAETARNGSGWDRRAAAVALALRLREEADPDIVMPGLLDWLQDMSTDDHELPVGAVASLGPLPAEWEDRVREAMVTLAGKRAPANGDPDNDWTPEDRDIVIRQGLAPLIPNAQVLDVLHQVLTDEDDDYAPRVAAIRVLSENHVFDRFDAWKSAGASSDEVVRQAVADNLFRAEDRAFGEILKPMHTDPHSLVRAASLDSQLVRRQPTMLDVIDQLLEDHDEWVRYAATEAVAAFRDAPGSAQRAAMLIRMLEESDSEEDVVGAALALYQMTDEAYGFRTVDLHVHAQEIDEAALQAFMGDAEGRSEAAQKYRARFGGATYTKEDRIAVLEKLLKHPDPENRARAAALLDELR